MFEQIRAGQGRPLSWKWGVLGFAALPYASVAAADIVAVLVRLAGMALGHEAPYEALARIERLGALPTLPLVDASLSVYLRTGSWALAGVAYYALLV
ncbi:MAG TPA: hypothetical protein VNI57_05350, partial [Candidatus Saccharimonadales bacterium]|nr:hypothetical protein [Candidatus Saccharimonadales bacterium]